MYTSFHLIYECRKSKATLISIILLATPPRETPEMMTSVNLRSRTSTYSYLLPIKLDQPASVKKDRLFMEN